MTYSVSSGMLNPTISILYTLVKKLCDKNKMYVHRPFQQDLKQQHFTLPEAADLAQNCPLPYYSFNLI